MTEGKRPGGLTALAVLNFVFGGIGILFGALGMVGFIVILYAELEANLPPEQQQEFLQLKEALQEVGIGVLGLILGLSVVSYLLEIVAGIGYLLQKRFLGWVLGNAFALIYIFSTILGVVLLSRIPGGGFNLGSVIGLIYPVVTLVLINTTFKDDLVN